ncbi:MAG: hypothetical protein AB1714_26545 [Acidobacteriota bacterium]
MKLLVIALAVANLTAGALLVANYRRAIWWARGVVVLQTLIVGGYSLADQDYLTLTLQVGESLGLLLLLINSASPLRLVEAGAVLLPCLSVEILWVANPIGMTRWHLFLMGEIVCNPTNRVDGDAARYTISLPGADWYLRPSGWITRNYPDADRSAFNLRYLAHLVVWVEEIPEGTWVDLEAMAESLIRDMGDNGTPIDVASNTSIEDEQGRRFVRVRYTIEGASWETWCGIYLRRDALLTVGIDVPAVEIPSMEPELQEIFDSQAYKPGPRPPPRFPLPRF